MIRIFNAIQLTSLFAAGPLIIDYLSDATFRGALPAFYIACAAYGLGFVMMCATVYDDVR